MKLTWQDIEEIAVQLRSRHPEKDPLVVSLPEIRLLVTELPSFGDDPRAADDSTLEAIQAAWYDES